MPALAKTAISLLTILLLSASLQGQQLLFENYSSEQGLSQNSCYSIAQDNDGFMWFGTQDGLNRYDGKEFKTFLPQTASGKNLPSNYITTLFFDQHRKILWIGSIRGICLYDPLKDSIMKPQELFPYAQLHENISVKKIVSFIKDEYWIVTASKGLLLLNTKSGALVSFFDSENTRGHVSSIEMHQGKIIVALTNKLFFLLPDAGRYNIEPLFPDRSFPEIKELYSFNDQLLIGTLEEGCLSIDDNITANPTVRSFITSTGGIGCFTTDASGNLWIGTRGNGIIRYEPGSGNIKEAANNRYDSRSLGKNFVLSLFKNRQGIIWCGLSGSGISKYDPLKYQFEAVSNEPLNPESLPDNMVFDIFRSGNGRYYVGTQNNGLAEWNIKANKFYRYDESLKFGASGNTIYDITEDEKNNLWIASWRGLLQLDQVKKKIVFHEVADMLTSKKLYGIAKLKKADSLFIAGDNGLAFFSLTEKQWKAFPAALYPKHPFIARYIHEDEKNVLWICTVGAGLVRYDYRQSSFDVVEPVKKISIYVRHLLQDGSLFWLATDNGIVLYDFERNKITKHIILNTTNLSNVCYAVQKDKKGFFWVSTNTGLYKINPFDYSTQHYNTGNGLSFLEYNTACAYQEEDGTLLFGGVGGITRFNPSLLKKDTFSPAPLITNIHINDQSLHPGTSVSHMIDLTLTYRQNFITFFFAVNNFSNQNNTQFSYRLSGLGNNWTNSGNRNFATYTSLPPGDYVFELRSANADGQWCEGTTTLNITISPPWWQAWWFRLGAFLILSGLAIFFVRKRIQTIRSEVTLKQKIAETEMMVLRTQMNPHFIFNSLNSIREMILNNENKEASHFLGKFAHLIRMTLDQSGQSFISLRNTVDYLTRYIEMEQIRNSHFTCRILIDDELDPDETVLPPMLIQPFVENAIWHGTTGKQKSININIDFKKKNNQLICLIEDNGIGINQSLKNKIHSNDMHRSVGIENINDRIRLFNEKYGLKSSIHINDKEELAGYPGTGTVVTIQIPLEITAE